MEKVNLVVAKLGMLQEERRERRREEEGEGRREEEEEEEATRNLQAPMSRLLSPLETIMHLNFFSIPKS